MPTFSITNFAKDIAPTPSWLASGMVLWCCSVPHLGYSLQPSCIEPGTAHCGRSCHLYPNHIAKKAKYSLLLQLLSVSGSFLSLLFPPYSVGWNWAKVFMNPWKFTWSSPSGKKALMNQPPVGWWQVLELAGNNPSWGPHSHLCPGWWTGSRGRWSDCEKSWSAWSPLVLPSTVMWMPKAPSPSGSSFRSSCTWRNNGKLKIKVTVHKYCTLVGKFVLPKRMN